MVNEFFDWEVAPALAPADGYGGIY